MATRQSVLGGGLADAADSIAKGVQRLDDIERAEKQLAIENTRAQTQLEMQQEQINIQQQAENRFQEQAEFSNAQAILNQLPAGSAFTLRDAAAAFPIFGERMGGLDLSGPLGDINLRPETMDTMRIAGITEAITAGAAPGATPEQINAGQVAQNFATLGIAGTDAQMLAAQTDDVAQRTLSTATANAMMAAERAQPGTLAESNGVLRNPYKDELTGVTINTLPGLEILLRMQGQRSATGGRGSEASIIDLKDDYLAYAEAEGFAIDPATARRLSEIQLTSDLTTTEGQAQFLDRMASLESSAAGAGPLFTLAIQGGVEAAAFEGGRSGDILQNLISSVDRAANPEVFNALMQMSARDAQRRATSSRQPTVAATPTRTEGVVGSIMDRGAVEGATVGDVIPEGSPIAATQSGTTEGRRRRAGAELSAQDQQRADDAEFEANKPTTSQQFQREFITEEGTASVPDIMERAGVGRARAITARRLIEKIRTRTRGSENPNLTAAQRANKLRQAREAQEDLDELLGTEEDAPRDTDRQPDRTDIGR